MSEKKTRSGSEKRQKNVLIAVRFSPEEAEIVKEKAEKNGLTVSTLIRKTVLGKQINARIDEDFLKELMRLGRLQKHLFVEGKRTGDKEYAEVLVAITELANTLRRNLMVKCPFPVIPAALCQATISANTSLNCWYEPSGSKPSFPLRLNRTGAIKSSFSASSFRSV